MDQYHPSGILFFTYHRKKNIPHPSLNENFIERMKPSEVIAQRFEARGYEICIPPTRIRAGIYQRCAGAASWFCLVTRKSDGVRYEIVSWNTMKEVVRCPDEEWDLDFNDLTYDLELWVPEKYFDKKYRRNTYGY